MFFQGKLSMKVVLFFLTLSTLLATGIWLSSKAHAGYKPIVSLSCPGGELVIDVQPGAAIGNGSASLTMRYRYRGITLKYFNYGRDEILLSYLNRDKSYIHALELNPMDGHWYNGAYPEVGHTLYLPPAQFTAEEVGHLAACIKSNKFKIKDAFVNTKIYGRAYLGLAETRTRVRLDGIAHLVHKDILPFINAHFMDDNGRLLMVIEMDGRVLLYNTYKDKKYPNEVIVWGHMISPQKSRRKPKLILRSVTVNTYGKPKIYDSESAKWRLRHSKEKYDITPE